MLQKERNTEKGSFTTISRGILTPVQTLMVNAFSRAHLVSILMALVLRLTWGFKWVCSVSISKLATINLNEKLTKHWCPCIRPTLRVTHLNNEYIAQKTFKIMKRKLKFRWKTVFKMSTMILYGLQTKISIRCWKPHKKINWINKYFSQYPGNHLQPDNCFITTFNY